MSLTLHQVPFDLLHFSLVRIRKFLYSHFVWQWALFSLKKRVLSPSRSSSVSWTPVLAPEGTIARPNEPSLRVTSASIVDFTESRTSRGWMWKSRHFMWGEDVSIISFLKGAILFCCILSSLYTSLIIGYVFVFLEYPYSLLAVSKIHQIRFSHVWRSFLNAFPRFFFYRKRKNFIAVFKHFQCYRECCNNK